MLCALDMSVHSTHMVYSVECSCRGLHTLVIGLSAVAQIALHWYAAELSKAFSRSALMRALGRGLEKTS